MNTSLRILLFTVVTLQIALPVYAEQPDGKNVETAASTATKTTGNEESEPSKSPQITWHNYEKGLELAKKEDKMLVIDFTTSWCGWCKRMERETFANQEVIEFFNENVVAVKVWGDSNTKTSHEGETMSEKALTRTYGVRGFPTFWFLDSEGNRIGPSPGYKKTEQFLPLIQYVAGNHYKTMSYENYLENKSTIK